MCVPPAAAAAAGGGGLALGTILQQQGVNAARRAREARLGEEAARQSAYAAEATGAFNSSLAKNDAGTRRGAEGRARDARGVALADVMTDKPAAMPLAGQNSPAVVGEAKRTTDRASSRAGDFAERLAAMGARGEVAFDSNLGLNRSRDEIGTVGSMAAGSANVLPIELMAANNAGARKRALADLFNQAGGFLMMQGISGGAFGAPTPKPAIPPHLTAPGMPAWSTAGVF